MPASTRGSRRIQAVEHAIDVLDAIARAGRPMGVSDIARQTGLSKATAHHLLTTLESRRLVMRDPASTRYRLGWALYEFGTSVVRDVDLSRIARPYLDKLAAQTSESVLLGILNEDSVLYLDRGEAPSGLRMVANAGRRGPLHATASGKILLAFAADPQLFDRIIAKPLPRYTPTTITNPTTLRHELAQVRQQGFATCWQEREVGLCSLAVAIRDYTGAAVASLTVAGPATRLTTRTLQAHLLPLQATGHQIETHLGGSRPKIEG
ncbi:MAG: IclR family transcriptional regulator [Micromonosporaceae bacterium]|jgi:DNA-binding IclR family transcriptional regulator|nr:IclR family transcriptional regulator [Micromonosporaceae bacterium]